MTEQPTLQDCVDELEKLKPELTIIHAERVTKIQKMIQSVLHYPSGNLSSETYRKLYGGI